MAIIQNASTLETPLTHSVNNNTVASSIETHALATPLTNQETSNLREEINTELITPIIEQETSTLRQALVSSSFATPMLLPSTTGNYVDPYDPNSIRFINNKCVYTCTGLCCAFDSALAPYQTQLLLSPVNINGALATTVEQALHMINTARTQVNADWNASSGISAICNKPVLASVATLGTYNSLIDTPDFAEVAYSGCYCDLCGLPTIPAAQVNSDWLATEGVALICNKPVLSCVACSGDYDDLLNKPDLCLIQQQSDWEQANSNCPTYIKNKPELARVATSGLYADLQGAPSIPEQVNSDWLALSGPAYICNKPSLSCVAISGDYNDLRNIPPDTSKTYTFSFDESTHKLAVTEHGLFGDTVIFNDTIDTAYSFTYEDNTLTITDNRNNTCTINLGTDFYTKGEVDALICAITILIPEQASPTNQLADKNFVNSSIATNTANFICTFNNLACLCATVATPNDYAFYAHCDACGNCVYDRYKYNASCVWVCEYTLNNSSFTADQWAAINSGITCTAVAKITDVYNCTVKLCNADGTTLLGSFTLNQDHNTCICLDVGGGSVTGIAVYCGTTCKCTIDDSTALCLSCNAFNTYAQISTTTYPGACCTGNVSATSLATVATSGNYNDLTGKPTIPTVNNKTITICHGTTCDGSFTLNQTTNCAITLPAYPPDLSNCAGLTCTGTVSSITLNGCAFTVTNGVASLSNFYPECAYGNADGLAEFSVAHIRNANWSVRNVWNQCGDNHSYLTSVKNNWECTSTACVQPVSVDKAYCANCATCSAFSSFTLMCNYVYSNYLRIRINDTVDWMLAFTIHLYSSYNDISIRVSGYRYAASNPAYSWYGLKAELLNATALQNNMGTGVIYGYETINNVVYPWVAISAGNYFGISISDITNGFRKVANTNDLFCIEAYTYTQLNTSPSVIQGTTTVCCMSPWQCILPHAAGGTYYAKLCTTANRQFYGIVYSLCIYNMLATLNPELSDSPKQTFCGEAYGSLAYAICTYNVANCACTWIRYSGYRTLTVTSNYPFQVLELTTTAPSGITFCSFVHCSHVTSQYPSTNQNYCVVLQASCCNASALSTSCFCFYGNGVAYGDYWCGGAFRNYTQTVDLTGSEYCKDCVYPVTVCVLNRTYADTTVLSILNSLNRGCTTDWMNHALGFSAMAEIHTNANGWGVVSPLTYTTRLSCNWIKDNGVGSTEIMGFSITALMNTSLATLYLRGGAKWMLSASNGATFVAHSSTYTINSQSVSPICVTGTIPKQWNYYGCIYTDICGTVCGNVCGASICAQYLKTVNYTDIGMLRWNVCSDNHYFLDTSNVSQTTRYPVRVDYATCACCITTCNNYCLDYFSGNADRPIIVSTAETSNNVAVTAIVGRSTACPLTFNPATGLFRADCFSSDYTAKIRVSNGNELNIYPSGTYSGTWINYRGGGSSLSIGNGSGTGAFGTLRAGTICSSDGVLTTCTGTVTISNTSTNTNIPVALCTGNTTVGISSSCPLTFNPVTGTLCVCNVCATNLYGTFTGVAYHTIDFSDICAGAHCMCIYTLPYFGGYPNCGCETYYYWVCPTGIHASYIHTSAYTTNIYVNIDDTWCQRCCYTGIWCGGIWCSGCSCYDTCTDSWKASYYLAYLLYKAVGSATICRFLFPASGFEGYTNCPMLTVCIDGYCADNSRTGSWLWISARNDIIAIDNASKVTPTQWQEECYGDRFSSCSAYIPMSNHGMLKQSVADVCSRVYLTRGARFMFTVVHSTL